jgi:hypothetical protein
VTLLTCFACCAVYTYSQFELRTLSLMPGDVLFLTALTGLTHLVLEGVSLQLKSDGSGGVEAVTALAQSLRACARVCEREISGVWCCTAPMCSKRTCVVQGRCVNFCNDCIGTGRRINDCVEHCCRMNNLV